MPDRRAEGPSQLADALEALELTVENAGLGLWERRLSDERLDGSPAWRAMLGVQPGERMTFEKLLSLMPADDSARVAAAIGEAVATRRNWMIDYRVTHPDGNVRWIHSLGRAYYAADGTPERLRGCTQDITARKEAELELAERSRQVALLNLQLERRVLDAETAKRARDAFLRNLSHEFRTPLHQVQGAVQILALGEQDAKQQKWLPVIRAASEQLLRLVDQALSMVELKSQRFILQQFEFSPTAVVEEVRLMMLPRAETKSLSLELGDCAGLPEAMVGDPVRLAEALMNYVDNAIKFTESGTVTLAARRVQQEGQALLRFEVADTGPGVPGHLRDTLFDDFEQGDTTITRLHGGLGMGLPNTRGLVTVMGGEVGMEPSPTGGSIFWLTIPLTAATRGT